MTQQCKDAENLQHSEAYVLRNQNKTLVVLIISFITMVVEVTAGSITGSMGLLADGWHMGSHVAALLLSYFVYRLARSPEFSTHFTFGTSKLFSLGGFTSAIGLGLISVFMAYESIIRLMSPVSIQFDQALLVCFIGLGVNLLSAVILKDSHQTESGHEHEHDHDHNRASALAHVMADALTSVTAIFALLIAKYFHVTWIDPLIGMLGSIVILRWSYSLIKHSAHELLDAEDKTIDSIKVKSLLEASGGKVVDLHVWSVGAGKIVAIASVETTELKGAGYYHEQLAPEFNFSHVVVEEIKIGIR